MCLEALALAEQQELHEAHLADLIRQFAAPPVERRWLALDQLCWPFEVIPVVEPGFKYPEERVVLQPVRLVMAKLLMGSTQICPRPGSEVGPGCLEQPVFERHD